MSDLLARVQKRRKAREQPSEQFDTDEPSYLETPDERAETMRADARQTNETYISRKAQREAVALHDRLLAWLLNDPAIVKTAGIPHCITVPEMAAILGISPRTAYERVRERRLPGIQHEPAGEVIVPIPMLIKFLAGEAWTTPAFEALIAPAVSLPNVRRRTARRSPNR